MWLLVEKKDSRINDCQNGEDNADWYSFKSVKPSPGLKKETNRKT